MVQISIAISLVHRRGRMRFVHFAPTAAVCGLLFANIALAEEFCEETGGAETFPTQILNKPYSEARPILMEYGWYPEEQKHEYIGATERWAEEAGYTEYDFCRGTGLADCRFYWRDEVGNYLVVLTTGDEGWDVPGAALVCRDTDWKVIHMFGRNPAKNVIKDPTGVEY
jgi:hypothetical protein